MSSIRIMAVGDTGPAQQLDESIFSNVKNVLSSADISFAQVERVFSERGQYQVATLGHHSRVSPKLVSEYQYAGFDVLGLASNHSFDWGEEGFLDTLDCFQNAGFKTIGAGRNIAEARKPVIIEKNGIKVAFLGYCSVLAHQSWALEDRPGCAPLRADTFYTAYEYQPGTPARILTVPDEADVKEMIKDIKAVREQVDYVICSMHFGVHWMPRYIAQYQIDVAHAAIDAGCDIILGHHAHLLKGIEVYKNKPIIYSLANFAMGRSGSSLGVLGPEGKYRFEEVYDMHVSPDYTYKHKQYYKHTVIADFKLGNDGTIKLQLIPTYIEDGPKPTVLQQSDPRFNEVVRLLEWSSEIFETKLKVQDRVIELVLP